MLEFRSGRKIYCVNRNSESVIAGSEFFYFKRKIIPKINSIKLIPKDMLNNLGTLVNRFPTSKFKNKVQNAAIVANRTINPGE